MGNVTQQKNMDMLKKESDGNYTKYNPTSVASNTAVADTAKHFSSDPKNVENVLAELFQYGTNGKNDIYNAISAKGTTPASKSFADLVSAIGNISTGKKIASGVGISSDGLQDYTYDYGGYSKAYLTVSGLTFKASLIVVCERNNPQNPTVYCNDSRYNGPNSANDNIMVGDELIQSISPAYINDTGFSLPVYYRNVYSFWIAVE